MTTNAPEDSYGPNGYIQLLQRYQNMFGTFVGPAKVFTSSETLQVSDYSKYDWTMFDAEARKQRHEKVFPEDRQKAFALGAQMTGTAWE